CLSVCETPTCEINHSSAQSLHWSCVLLSSCLCSSLRLQGLAVLVRSEQSYTCLDQVTRIYNRMNSISQHISRKRYSKANTNVIYYINDKMSDTEYAEY